MRVHGIIYDSGAILYDTKLVEKFYTNRMQYHRGMERLERAGYIQLQRQEKRGYKTISFYRIHKGWLEDTRRTQSWLSYDFSDIDELFERLTPIPLREEPKYTRPSEYLDAVQGQDHVIRPVSSEKNLGRLPHKKFSRLVSDDEYELGGYGWSDTEKCWVKIF